MGTSESELRKGVKSSPQLENEKRKESRQATVT